MRTYAKVWLEGHRPFYLQVTARWGQFMRGTEVDEVGDEIVPLGRDAEGRRYTEREHVIDTDAIKRIDPYVMDRHYGWLVPDPEICDDEA